MRAAAVALALFLLAGPAAAPQLRQISRSGRGAYEASLTRIARQLIATWYDTRDGHPEIYLRVLDSQGRPAGPERRITHNARPIFAYEPDVDALREDVAMAWYERDTRDNTYQAMLALVTRAGRIVWQHTLSAKGHDGKDPVVRVVNGDILVAWLESANDLAPEVRAQWFDASGVALTPSRHVAPAGKTTWNLNAAVDASGTAWVVFDATAGTATDELFLARVGRTSADVIRLTPDDGFASKYPDLAFNGSQAALTWWDERDGNDEVYLAVVPSGELHEGVDARAMRVTNTPGESIGAYVAWNRNVVGLAWCDNTEGQHEIYVERFDQNGRALGEAERLTRNASNSLIPAILPWRDGFALVWNEFVAGRGGGHGADGRSEVWFAWVAAQAAHGAAKADAPWLTSGRAK